LQYWQKIVAILIRLQDFLAPVLGEAVAPLQGLAWRHEGPTQNLANEKRAKKFLRTPLEIDFGFSNSIFAAFGGAGR
jgi:hypothetical protein